MKPLGNVALSQVIVVSKLYHFSSMRIDIHISVDQFFPKGNQELRKETTIPGAKETI